MAIWNPPIPIATTTDQFMCDMMTSGTAITTTPMTPVVYGNTPEPAPAPTLEAVEAALTQAPVGQFFFVGDTVKIRHGVKQTRNQPETEPDAGFCGYKGTITAVRLPPRGETSEPLYTVKFSNTADKRFGNYLRFVEKELELVVKKERKKK